MSSSRLVRAGLLLAATALAAPAAALSAADPATATEPGRAPATATRPATQDGGWRWPLDPPVAVRRGFDRPAGPYAPGHRGVDLAGAVGAPVRAAARGTVVLAEVVAGEPVVVVAHGPARTVDELRSTYEPVASTLRAGAVVQEGATLGTVARWPSHCGDAPCLHWGLRRGATYLDPTRQLGRRVRLLPLGGPVPRAADARAAVGAAPAAVAPLPPATNPATPSRGAGGRSSSRLPRAVRLVAAAAGTGLLGAAAARVSGRPTRRGARQPRPRGSSP